MFMRVYEATVSEIYPIWATPDGLDKGEGKNKPLPPTQTPMEELKL